MTKLKKVRYYCPACKDFIILNVARATKTLLNFSGHNKRVVMRRARDQEVV